MNEYFNFTLRGIINIIIVIDFVDSYEICFKILQIIQNNFNHSEKHSSVFVSKKK